ncbi:type II CAAX prenyl endopeptidase Rce1 family protein [Erythrobacter sp. MTPC3]|uniref:CPBP family glutamic-type intramembrane protease n=1 Tax=Erythrobacter sp. MTPC3 TaxID=3056564 RepID=UPI0036F40C23
MTGQTTSPLVESDAPRMPAANAAEEWRGYLQFLKRPDLPQGTASYKTGVIGTMRIFGLDLIVMFIILSVLFAVIAAGFELPENYNSTLELNFSFVLLAVVVAPVIEELAFRSWLTGRPRFLYALGVLFITGIIAVIVWAAISGPAGETAPGLVILAGMGAAVIASILGWKRTAPEWFAPIFPAAFWLSSAAFALVHLFNYAEGALWVLLPLIVPQFILGTMAAYVRVQYGFVYAVLLHAAHNGFAISVAALSMQSG